MLCLMHIASLDSGSSSSVFGIFYILLRYSSQVANAHYHNESPPPNVDSRTGAIAGRGSFGGGVGARGGGDSGAEGSGGDFLSGGGGVVGGAGAGAVLTGGGEGGAGVGLTAARVRVSGVGCCAAPPTPTFLAAAFSFRFRMLVSLPFRRLARHRSLCSGVIALRFFFGFASSLAWTISKIFPKSASLLVGIACVFACCVYTDGERKNL